MQNLAKASLPPLLSVPAGDSVNFNWVPAWIPQGFSEVPAAAPLPTIETPVESRLYSDGLFSFSSISTAQRQTALNKCCVPAAVR
jgi:sigma-E factor negative regulatory protein RseB